MARTSHMSRQRAAEIMQSGALASCDYRALDFRSALDGGGPGGQRGDERMPAELGRMKTADRKLVSVLTYKPRVTNMPSNDRSLGALRQVFQPSGEIVSLLPTPVADAWSHYLQESAPGSTVGRATAAERAFVGQLMNEAKRVHGKRMAGCRMADLSPRDQAIYYFASAMAAMHKVLRVRMATPTILGVCNVQDYGTDLLAWSDTLEGFRASLPSRSSHTSGGPATTTDQDSTLLTGRLKHTRQKWNIDGARVKRHQESQGREGAPTWDLLDQTIADSMAVVDTDVARLMAFGTKPGTAPPSATQIPGMLYAKAASPLDITNVSGEVNYSTLRDWLIAQKTGTNASQGLTGDTLVLCPTDYDRLSGQPVNSAGSDMSVIDWLLLKVPFLSRILTAREFQPFAAEEANLVLAGMSAAQAKLNSGGIGVGGVQKRAIAFFRDDPEVCSFKRGHEPRTEDAGLSGGTYGGEVEALSGGFYLYQGDGFQLAYQS
jgi:hypothetical protein